MKLARELNEDRPNCRFLVNAAPDLGQLETDSFDLVYSSLVLQHAVGGGARHAISEFLRILRPGGLVVFQALSRPAALRSSSRRRRFQAEPSASEQLLMMKMKLTPGRGLACFGVEEGHHRASRRDRRAR